MKRLRLGAIISTLAAVTGASSLALGQGQQGQGQVQTSEVEELRREVRILRSQIQTLRSAMSEAAERDAQKAAALARALEGLSSAASDSTFKPREREDGTEKSARAAAAAAAAPAVAAAPPPMPAPNVRGGKRGAAEAARKSPEAPPSQATIQGNVSVPRGEPVAYVYVENVFAPAVKDQSFSIKQVGKAFSPAWAVVQRGSTISFPNKDNIYHNVFSLSSGNSFDLGLYSGGESKSHTFNEPGEVEIYCNIHPQMAASALVVPNRLFAKVKPDGSFEIAGVPSGKRKVVAWAPGSRMATTWVDVEAGAAAKVDMKLEPKSGGHKNKAGGTYGSYE